MTTSTPSYDRALSPELKRLLSPGGFLELLPGLNRRQVAGVELDVHLRVDDEVDVYCGHTKLLDAQRTGNGAVEVDADNSYKVQACAGDLFRHWSTNESVGFELSLGRYLDNVAVGRRHVAGEGAVQCLRAKVTEPWISFDREAVLAYTTPGPEQNPDSAGEIALARTELKAMADSKRWAPIPKVGNQPDRLAVDPEGRLVLLELKNAGAGPASVFYSPYQLLHYVWEWYCALEVVRPQLQDLIDSRVELGLTPAETPRLTGGIRPAMGFGPDLRSAEVKRRYSEVLKIVNRHLPSGVPPVETWIIEDGASPAWLPGS